MRRRVCGAAAPSEDLTPAESLTGCMAVSGANPRVAGAGDGVICAGCAIKPLPAPCDGGGARMIMDARAHLASHLLDR